MVAGTAGLAKPALAQGLPTGGGGQAGCPPSFSIGVGLGDPVPVGGAAQVSCPYVQGAPGKSYGPTNTVPHSVTLLPGQDCSQVLDIPTQLVAEHAFDGSPAVRTFGPWPPSGAWGPGAQYSASPLQLMGAANNLYWQYLLDGTWNGASCQPKDPKNPWKSYSWLCNGQRWSAPAPVLFPPSCLIQQSQSVTSPGGLDPNQVSAKLVNLRDRFQSFIQPGQISSAPAQAGLVNYPTCFFVNGMNIPQQATYVLKLMGPDDGFGRHIFFVFQITISYQRVQWDFDTPNGVHDEAALPNQCLGRTGQLQTAHTYAGYSDPRPGGVYEVTATQTYGVDVTEFWVDSSNQLQSRSLGDAGVPPINVTLGPYPQRVIQEEGVPIAGA
jgi:hypothetical protein